MRVNKSLVARSSVCNATSFVLWNTPHKLMRRHNTRVMHLGTFSSRHLEPLRLFAAAPRAVRDSVHRTETSTWLSALQIIIYAVSGAYIVDPSPSLARHGFTTVTSARCANHLCTIRL